MVDRADLHNASVDTEAAVARLCGMLDLPSGRVCVLPARHTGPCEFHSRDDGLRRWIAAVFQQHG